MSFLVQSFSYKLSSFLFSFFQCFSQLHFSILFYFVLFLNYCSGQVRVSVLFPLFLWFFSCPYLSIFSFTRSFYLAIWLHYRVQSNIYYCIHFLWISTYIINFFTSYRLWVLFGIKHSNVSADVSWIGIYFFSSSPLLLLLVVDDVLF